MHPQIKKYFPSTLISLVLAAVIIIWGPSTPWINAIHWKIYDRLMKAKIDSVVASEKIKDILLVVIDNRTIQNMEHRWPYPRSVFAQVLADLKKANPKIIAFDFAFFGSSSKQDDSRLAEQINTPQIILPRIINDDGSMSPLTRRFGSHNAQTGIVTKIQDKDGIVRRNLTYIVNKDDRRQGFLSLEMQVLKCVKSIDFLNFVYSPNSIEFENPAGEKWQVPLDPNTQAFLINFQTHAQGLKRLSFYDVYHGNFEPNLVKDKIVFIGFLSSLLGDIHNTPIGWISGITLNANAFLTLYSHDFLRPVPRFWEILVIFLGVIFSCFLINRFPGKSFYLFIMFEIVIFISASYVFLQAGYFWNYFLFPLAVFATPYFGKKTAEIFKKYLA